MTKIYHITQLENQLFCDHALCHGVFDFIHFGHIKYFEKAKNLTGKLIVSITPDEFVNKGPNRPYYDTIKRSEMLASLEIVDLVIINNKPDAIDLIKKIKPKYYVKGVEYKNNFDLTGKMPLEEAAIISVGGEIKYLSGEIHSSTKIINDFFQTDFTKSQKKVLKHLRNKINYTYIEELFSKISNLKVLLIGETIVDTYRFCAPQAISSKSPTVSAKFLKEENYTGGTLACAKHLSEIGADVTVYSPVGTEDFMENLLTNLDPKIKFLGQNAKLVTPRKIRYLTEFMKQKIFEVTIMDDSALTNNELSEFENLVKNDLEYDLIIAFDFGHGLFENSRLEALENIKCFKTLNVQTNSSNFGYNLYTKHKNYNLLSIDEREFRLGLSDRYSTIEKLIKHKKVPENLVLTLGDRGSVFVRDDFGVIPVFIENPIDTTGSGDAFFVMVSILKYLQCDDTLSAFIGNIHAGLQSKIIGNKTSVPKQQLMRNIKGLLG